MGRAVATRGQRRLGRTIRKLGESVELSSKETTAKIEEQKVKRQTQEAMGYSEDSAIENLRDPLKWKKNKQ